jgi:hypothetical protein
MRPALLGDDRAVGVAEDRVAVVALVREHGPRPVVVVLDRLLAVDHGAERDELLVCAAECAHRLVELAVVLGPPVFDDELLARLAELREPLRRRGVSIRASESARGGDKARCSGEACAEERFACECDRGGLFARRV